MTARFKGLARAFALAAAAGVLPCCQTDDVGAGDQIALATVRASILLTKVEPLLDCVGPALSPDGLLVAFSSTSGNLTSGDSNGLEDIFIKDRRDGSIVNVTKVVVPVTSFPPYAPAACSSPAISADGRYVAFLSTGGYVPYTAPASTLPNPVVWRYDRLTKTFARAFVSAAPPDRGMTSPSISADGRYVAFASAASNMTPANPGFVRQIWVMDMQAGVMTLVSTDAAGTGRADAWCNDPKITPDGLSIVFWTFATNLLSPPTTLGLVYVGSRTGTPPVLVSRGTANAMPDSDCYMGALSDDGRTVVFGTYATNVPTGGVGSPRLVRRDILSGALDVVTSVPGLLPFAVYPNGYVPAISGDGAIVSFLSRSDTLSAGTPLGSFANVFVWNGATGTTSLVSRHQILGTPSDSDCSLPQVSSDGRWVAWATDSDLMVDGDTNGASDVFLRGPLR